MFKNFYLFSLTDVSECRFGTLIFQNFPGEDPRTPLFTLGYSIPQTPGTSCPPPNMKFYIRHCFRVRILSSLNLGNPHILFTG